MLGKPEGIHSEIPIIARYTWNLSDPELIPQFPTGIPTDPNNYRLHCQLTLAQLRLDLGAIDEARIWDPGWVGFTLGSTNTAGWAVGARAV